MAYVTSNMACNEPNSATPMSQQRIDAQNARVSKVARNFESGNRALDEISVRLGGIGIGNPPGTTPRVGAPDFRNAPSCDASILPGGLYGRRVPIPGTGTGQPQMTPDGLKLPSIPPGTPQPQSNPWIDPNTPNPGALSTTSVAGGSSPSAGPTPGSGATTPGFCQPKALTLATSPEETNWTPWIIGTLVAIVGLGALTGGNR